MVDREAALDFLRRSRSRLVRTAADWIVSYDDPVDLLFVLSRDTADALGPWETFRYASLLGLLPATAVRELGLDVLVEPVPEGDPRPPVEQAMALGHAVRAFPDEDAPFVADVRAALDARGPQGFHEAVLDGARLVVTALLGESTADLEARVQDHLAGPDGPNVAATLLEAAALAGLEGELTDAALVRVSEGQQPDGAVRALSEHDIIRGLTTLRVLCLLQPPGSVRS